MLDREPFLKAIYANPADDLPRLVFADYLEETGHEEWAHRMRRECEEATANPGSTPRGLPLPSIIKITEESLENPELLRLSACSDHPEWYGATQLAMDRGKITTKEMLEGILASPVTEHVTDVDFSGSIFEERVESPDGLGLAFFEMVYKPVITVPMVEHLATLREVRRLVRLNLINNDLDNDAARALIRSPHLFRLKQLKIYEGSRFKARTWQQLIERFGEAVVE